MKLENYNLLAIIGATATGKTSLAVDLAKHLDGEILSADSRQVYRGLDLGSGKDLDEYDNIPYHLIDIIEPSEEYDLFRYQKDFHLAYQVIINRGKTPIMCGGSSMYINAILNNYEMKEVATDEPLRQDLQSKSMSELQQLLMTLKPEQHNQTDLLERNRLIRALEIASHEQNNSTVDSKYPSIIPLVIALEWPREIRRKRIVERLKARFSEGMIEEVKSLHEQGVSWDKLYYFGLEYRLIALYLQDELNYNDMFQKLASAIAKFAKKQDTWLRKMEREGLSIHRLEGGPDLVNRAKAIIQYHLAS